MAILLFTNNAQAVLAAPVAAADTTMRLATGSGELFPNPQTGEYFVATLRDALTKLVVEIVWVTARDADVVTVTRGQENTTPSNWLPGDAFGNLWTAGQADAIQGGEALASAVASLTQQIQAGDSSLQTQVTAIQTADADFVTNESLVASVYVETARAEGVEIANAATAAAATLAEKTRAIAEETSLQSQIVTLQSSGGSGGGTIALPLNAQFVLTNSAGAAVAGTFGGNLVVGGGNTVSVTRTGFPINLHPSVASLPGAGLPQILATVDVHPGEAASYPVNLTGSIIKSGTAPDNAYVVTLYQNGNAIATYSWAATHQGTGYFVPTVVCAAFQTATNDVLQWIGQTVPDAGISNIRFGMHGTLL